MFLSESFFLRHGTYFKVLTNTMRITLCQYQSILQIMTQEASTYSTKVRSLDFQRKVLQFYFLILLHRNYF